jgi:hypothetical protein
LILVRYRDLASREENIDGAHNSLDVVPAEIRLCSSWFLQHTSFLYLIMEKKNSLLIFTMGFSG